MEKIILIGLTLLSFSMQAQTVEEFDAGNSWIFNNGAGIEDYGFSESYATFNLDGTVYPNSSNIIIKSRALDFTGCSNLTVSFPIEGIIENNFDIMRFQYKDSSGTWVTDTAFSGYVDMVYTSGILPNTLTKFRFKLTTDGSVNSYTLPGDTNTYAYYYDIANFTTYCASTLPVELLYFGGYEYKSNGMISWATGTEVNNDRFELYHSMDAIEWEMVHTQLGQGNSNVTNEYTAVHKLSNGVNYYQLKQIDYDGQNELFDIISIAYNVEDSIQEVFYNLLGQPVGRDFRGFKISNLNNKQIK
mgnify:FL=1